jgi:hypothetical protein
MAMSIQNNIASIGELQRDYLFKVQIAEFPSGLDNSSDYDSLKEDIDAYLVKGVFPNRKTAEIAHKWSGETFYFSGVDESPKTGDLVFRMDEDSLNFKFWDKVQQLTGDRVSHAAAPKYKQTFKINVFMIKTDKQTVSTARTLSNVIAYSGEDIAPDKEASGIQLFKVHISWDWSSDFVAAVNTSLGSTAPQGKEGDTNSDAATHNDGAGAA